MYEHAFTLEVVCPRGVVFAGNVTSVSAPGTAGAFQILYNHAPLLSTIGTGPLKVKNVDGTDMYFATSGGFLEVRANRVAVIVETVERANQIDVARAAAARRRAEERLHSRSPDIDVERAQAALLRALNRLRVSRFS